MNKFLLSFKFIAFSLLLALNANAQDRNAVCGADVIKNQLFEQQPQIKEQYEAKLAEFNSLKRQGRLQAKTNEIFEIPIVVHILDDGTGKYTPTEAQISQWIARANSIFDGTANDVKGPSEGGTTLPVKLVLAKRTPDNKKTNGIIVHDLSNNSQYVNNGVNGTGISNSYIQSNINWDSNSYYNIYVTNKIDGVNRDNTTTSYTAGYAYLPGSGLDLSVMLYHVVVNQSDTTFAHEMMHAFGVVHPFNGGDGDGKDCGSSTNDGINDTQNIRSGLWFGSSRNTYNQYVIYPTVGVTINDCTNTPFDTTLYNIMNYGPNRDRFTVGQGDMALAAIQYYRFGFKTSKALIEADGNNFPQPKNSCEPAKITNVSTLGENQTYNTGMQVVKLGTINNVSGLHGGPTPKFYYDFTKSNDINTIYMTELDIKNTHTITLGANSNNNIYYSVYIDQNNDGLFSSNEIVVNNIMLPLTDPRRLATINHSFKLLPTTVLNQPLRMRVIGDSGFASFGACDDRRVGEVEDYTVIVKDSSLSTTDLNNKTEVSVLTSGNEVIVKANEIIEAVEIFDINGRLIEKRTSINKVNFSIKLNSFKGIVIVNTKFKSGKAVHKKVIIN